MSTQFRVLKNLFQKATSPETTLKELDDQFLFAKKFVAGFMGYTRFPESTKIILSPESFFGFAENHDVQELFTGSKSENEQWFSFSFDGVQFITYLDTLDNWSNGGLAYQISGLRKVNW